MRLVHSIGTLLIGASTLSAQAGVGLGDPLRGEKLFRRQCTRCHSLHENRAGPRLDDVYGRTIGTVPGFRYSVALQAGTFAWSDTSLNAWLTGPSTFVRGAAMPARVKDADERVDIIAYLRAVRANADGM